MKSNTEKMLREILLKKDPFGYYVVVAINNDEVINLAKKYGIGKELTIEEVGNMLIIRGKSRKTMGALLRVLLSRKLVLI